MGHWSYYKVPEELLSPFVILSSSRGTTGSVCHISKCQKSGLTPFSNAGYRNYCIAILTLVRAIMGHNNNNNIFFFLVTPM